MAALSVTAASVLPSTSSQSEGTLGETATAGQWVYLKSSDSRLWLAQCDGTAAEATVVGVLLSGGGAGQPVKYATSGPINCGATTAKLHYYLNPTAGGIGPIADVTSGFYITRLGYATATDGSLVVDIKATGVTT
jgi:hypothetical protein